MRNYNVYIINRNNVPKRKFGHIKKSEKRCDINVSRFFGVTFFIRIFMHVREKSVIAIV